MRTCLRLFRGRIVWVSGARSEHIEGYVSLFEVFAPVGEPVGWRSTCSDCYEVIFPCPDGSFGRVGAVDVWWSILECCIVFNDEVLNVF